MLSSSLHWAGALVVAVGVHALGLAWFDPGSSPLPKPNAFSEEVVVMLGEGSGKSAELAAAMDDPNSVSGVSTPGEVTENKPVSVIESSIGHDEIESTVSPLTEKKVENPPSVTSASPEAAVLEQNQETSRSMRSNELVEVVSIDNTLDPMPSPATGARVEVTDQIAVTENAEPTPVDIESPDDVTHTLVSPTQLIPESREPTTSSVVQAEDLPQNQDTVVARQIPNSEPNRQQQTEQSAVSPVTAVPVVTASVETPAINQAQVEESQPAVVSDVEPEIRIGPEPAVVLEFDSVEAIAVDPAQVAEPQAAQTASIEDQIARSLTVDEVHSVAAVEGIVARYAGELKGRLEDSMYYPRAARLAGQEGRVVVRFVIDRSGTVLSIVVEKASGHAVLDREAVEMIERGEPYPVMPDEMVGDVLELRVPIAYQIRDDAGSRDIPPINLE